MVSTRRRRQGDDGGRRQDDAPVGARRPMSRLSVRRPKAYLDGLLARAIAGVFAGCAVNNVTLELLVRADPGIGNTVTASQFVFIALVGLVTHLDRRLRLKPRHSPFSFVLATTAVFLTVSIINNVVFKYNISLPFHMIFRSCSLVVSLLLGLTVFGKSYSMRQTLSCLMITAGVLLATFADSSARSSAPCCDNEGRQTTDNAADDGTLATWMFGVSLLVISLVLSAVLGHCQEWGYRKYGRHPQENMFYSHLMAAPFFLFLASDIGPRGAALLQSSPIDLLGVGLHPGLILLVNVVSQWVCVQSVYDVTALSTTLTCTFTLTIRKFLSLIISVVFLGNAFTLLHWLGTAMVFGGTVLYSLPADLFADAGPPPSTTTKTRKHE
ncbi:Sugar phosphate transporter domain-containing protein [Plasmodiophora brassicae]|uniref:Sugar phosphate transporter domain-containing protein n=1 Tax=Plasmodiophora brassicae TaxID=37360 RepID=A0A0G4IPP7_PLABS|nr:hypothetical protein PBRA_000540 [Plasmodiophora brassicae]SPQ97513.1 unnamed protein product [Plasmodiophora brassicae]